MAAPATPRPTLEVLKGESKLAVHFARKKIPARPPNQITDHWERSAAIDDLDEQRAASQKITSMIAGMLGAPIPAGADTRLEALIAQHGKVGACGEFATIAFEFLISRGIARPVDLVVTKHEDGEDAHEFVIIGLEAKAVNLSLANPDLPIVICDPWMSFMGEEGAKWGTYAGQEDLVWYANLLDSCDYNTVVSSYRRTKF